MRNEPNVDGVLKDILIDPTCEIELDECTKGGLAELEWYQGTDPEALTNEQGLQKFTNPQRIHAVPASTSLAKSAKPELLKSYGDIGEDKHLTFDVFKIGNQKVVKYFDADGKEVALRVLE